MKIKKAKIENWRSIKAVDISIEDLMIFIGQNNHGKSNILSSILFFFSEIKCEQADFNDTSKEIKIEIEFGDLDASDKTTFKKYVTSRNTIRVQKIASKPGTGEYHGYCESATDTWLKEDNATNFATRDAISQTPLAGFVPQTGRISKDMVIAAQKTYTQQHQAELTFEYILETTNFMGDKNVAKGLFGDVYYVPSVKNASDELSTKESCAFGKLYSHIINKMSEQNTEYKTAKDSLLTLITTLNKTRADGTENTNRPPELKQLETSIENELTSWGAKVDLEVSPPKIDDIFRVGTTVWIDDGIRTDITRKGHGLQRALIFALLRALSKLPDDTPQGTSRQASNSTFFILEEPELYLHPQAQRELFETLEELSDKGNQVLLCTHSNSFISLEKYKSICIVKKNNIAEGTITLQCTDDLFPEADEKRIFNMVYWINPDRSELFFAKKTILLEGPTDKTVIPVLAKKLSVFHHDYSLIDCGGKDSIPSYIKLLNKFSIPYVAVYDLDHQAGKTATQIQSADASTQKITVQIDGRFGKTVSLTNDIEEEIGITDPAHKNKPYHALKVIEETTYTIPESLKVKIREIFS